MRKLSTSKVVYNYLAISRIPLKNPKKKQSFYVTLAKSCKIYYKQEGNLTFQI
jgi:hypothetical protein